MSVPAAPPQGKTPAQQANSATPRDQSKPTSYPHADAVNVSPEIAERRADLGKDASLGQIQAFDGPAPETINGESSIVPHVQCIAVLDKICTLSQAGPGFSYVFEGPAQELHAS
jgi:hypothetical protein